MTHSYLCHHLCIHVPWLNLYVWHDSWLMAASASTADLLRSLMCVSWLIPICYMAHSYVCHESQLPSSSKLPQSLFLYDRHTFCECEWWQTHMTDRISVNVYIKRCAAPRRSCLTPLSLTPHSTLSVSLEHVIIGLFWHQSNRAKLKAAEEEADASSLVLHSKVFFFVWCSVLQCVAVCCNLL